LLREERQGIIIAHLDPTGGKIEAEPFRE